MKMNEIREIVEKHEFKFGQLTKRELVRAIQHQQIFGDWHYSESELQYNAWSEDSD